MRWLKKTTAYRANQILGRNEAFWHREYYDHWVRTEEELQNSIRYVEENPVAAGLAEAIESWK